MNYFKAILILCLLMVGNETFSSQAPQKSSIEKIDPYFIQIDPYFIQEICLPDRTQKSLTKISILLFKRFGALSKVIGRASLNYDSKENRLFLDYLNVHEQYRNMLMGSYLFKYAIAYCQKNIHSSLIDWYAVPSGSHTEANAQGLERLVNFYRNSGSVADSMDVENIIAEMHYPIRAAHMLAVLMPVLEPKPLSKNDKIITFAHGSTYATSKSDVLGIIAKYIGESNE